MEYLFADKISGLCNSTKNRNGKVCLWCLMQHEDFQTWETVETFKIPFENVWISLLRNHLNLKIIVFYVGLVLVRCFFNGNWKWISQSTDKVTRKKSPLTTFSFPLLLLSCPKISFLLFSRSTYSRRKIRKLLAALFSRNFLPLFPSAVLLLRCPGLSSYLWDCGSRGNWVKEMDRWSRVYHFVHVARPFTKSERPYLTCRYLFHWWVFA